ncbi:uncharacterized protein PHALS_04065 [Plasmopara halstedii]|uniref:Uncharacterized protein n=1 Tax=Plasmopara halstedii TaxID=4781 RepID=A0A0P1A920_PLAHL|nr:uncharacterized protein PHALS_04065 [Plasmopara halstedii]CEG36808.1 hypothetical protein PHALS_04065 [Plasmopara halstedii]|eukprot:XP_024573177.1 hypothetical protein PHALS_04065 [Plasmopara halstedii]
MSSQSHITLDASPINNLKISAGFFACCKVVQSLEVTTSPTVPKMAIRKLQVLYLSPVIHSCLYPAPFVEKTAALDRTDSIQHDKNRQASPSIQSIISILDVATGYCSLKLLSLNKDYI